MSSCIKSQSSGVLTTSATFKLSANKNGFACFIAVHRLFINTAETLGQTTGPWTTPDNSSSNEDVAVPYATY